MTLGFASDASGSPAQLRILRLFDHHRQRPGDLVLGIVDILQGMNEEIVQRLDIFVNKPMVSTPCRGGS